MAAKHSPDAQKKALPEAVPAQSLPGVLRTGGFKTAAWREKRRNVPLVPHQDPIKSIHKGFFNVHPLCSTFPRSSPIHRTRDAKSLDATSSSPMKKRSKGLSFQVGK